MSQIFNLLLMCVLIVPSIPDARYNSFRNTESELIFELKAGKSILKISANGGRIISYKYGDKEILTQATEHENFGSTLWTAPQSGWGWPPFAVLDEQDYEVEKQRRFA